MTPQALPLEPESATDKVARLFASCRGRWLSVPDIIAAGGGLAAWRTELSRCRRQFGMIFENRITRTQPGRVKSSEYRLVDVGWWPHKRPSERAA